jgi:O-antigen ligase
MPFIGPQYIAAYPGLPLADLGLHWFQPRPDFDGLVCGMTAALALHVALSGKRVGWHLILAGASGAMAAILSSRAGLLGFLMALLVILALSPARARIRAPRSARVATAAVIAAIPVALVLGATTESAQRLAAGIGQAGVGYSSSNPNDVGGARGTSRARIESWLAVWDYMQETPGRLIAGVGFGPDYLHDSGAEQKLLGSDLAQDVRAPHNYLVNSGARLGIFGLFIVIGLLITGLRLALTLARTDPDLTNMDVLAVLCVTVLPVGALFGVILESPFGAIPFFWALGHLSARVSELGAGRQIGRRLRRPIRRHGTALASRA